VISPESRWAYRDSGLPADELVRQLVADLPSLLAEGGTAQLLLSWIVREGVAAVGAPRAEVHAAALPLVRRMVELGFLLPR